MSFAAWREWRGRHRILSDLTMSIAVGIATLLFLVLIQPPTLSVVRREADDTADAMIRLAEQTAGTVRRTAGFTFIAIDEPAWAAWGSPLITPRDRLAELIGRAARSDPLAIIVDVDLAFPATPQGETALRGLFDHYAETAPPLLLVRSLVDAQTAAALPQQRPTVYDTSVAARPNIIWGAPLFLRDGDGRIRRWRLLVPSCRNGRAEALPSTHLVVAAMVRAVAAGREAAPESETALRAWQALNQRTAALAPVDCKSAAPTRSVVLADALGEAPPIRVDRSDVASRVLYTVAWSDDAIALGPTAATGHGLTSLVTVLPALAVLSVPDGAPVPGLAGRVVLIGGSYKASGDWYDTPLGRMPGALLILNAVDALARLGTPQSPPLVERALISLGIIVAVSLLTSFFRPVVATFLGSLVIVLVMLVSLAHFRSGIVLDLAVPAVAAALSDFVTTAIERLRDIWHEGWRWIFKPSSETPKANTIADPTKEEPGLPVS